MSAGGTCSLCEKMTVVENYLGSDKFLCKDCRARIDDSKQVKKFKESKAQAGKLSKKGNKKESEKVLKKAQKKLSKKIRSESKRLSNKIASTVYVVGASAFIDGKAKRRQHKIAKQESKIEKADKKIASLHDKIKSMEENKLKYSNRIENIKRDEYLKINQTIEDVALRSKKSISHYGLTSDGKGLVKVKDQWFTWGLTLKNEDMKLIPANNGAKVKEKKVKARILQKVAKQ